MPAVPQYMTNHDNLGTWEFLDSWMLLACQSKIFQVSKVQLEYISIYLSIYLSISVCLSVYLSLSLSPLFILCKNALYKNLKGSDPMRATYFQLYQAHSTLRI